MAESPRLEHFVLQSRRFEDKASRDENSITAQVDTPLAVALNDVLNAPAVVFAMPRDTPPSRITLKIKGEDAGTLEKPDHDIILKASTPSAFGRGEENVTDLEYRHGREISASDVKLGRPGNTFLKDLGHYMSESMFLGKEVLVKLYKLAVYEKGGHFKWHRDSTHSDQHHGTLLLALASDWEGGNLPLRHGGTTKVVDLHPGLRPATSFWDLPESFGDDTTSYRPDVADAPVDREDYNCHPANRPPPDHPFNVVGFFTDVEHMVEPVTAGTRFVLQFDVIVKGPADLDPQEPVLDQSDSWIDSKAHRIFSQGNEIVALKKLLDIFTAGLSDGPGIGFPLLHLYREASIKPKYLKGTDAVIYHALCASNLFAVSLHPILLTESSDLEGRFGSEDSELKVSAGSACLGKFEFHISRRSDIVELSRVEFVYYTGNEAQLAENRYFGGGMFVSLKSESKDGEEEKE